MKKEEIDKIAKAIAAKLAEPAGNRVLGCGSASSSENHGCHSGTYSCDTYECGGQGASGCTDFDCNDHFDCVSGVWACTGHFNCYGSYSDD